MPQQIPELAARLRALGYAGDPAVFADLAGYPMGAIVSLGGCSASFVSPDGLIVTNHHCTEGSLQYNSTPERNLLVDGFLARTRAEELWNGPGSRVYVTVAVTEVTAAITGGIDPQLADRDRFELIERRIKERVKAAEKDGLRCRVASFFESLRYFEILQLEIKDVRLVYAPPEGIGVFGGETDNWRWPRHTGDWGFYRAYVGPDGRSAPYSKDNVPFHPKYWLKVSPQGAGPGDFVFVVGYPGRTERHQLAAEIQDEMEWNLPRQIRRAVEQLAILDEVSRDNPETKIRVTNRVNSLNNGLTNNRGILEGLQRGGIMAKKRAQEEAFRAWIAAEPAARREFADALAALDRLQGEIRRTRSWDGAFTAVTGSDSPFMPGSLFGAAEAIHRLAIERVKADLDRDADYQERNWTRIREAQERLQRSLDLKADRALLRYGLQEALRLPADRRIAPLDAAIGLKPGMTEEQVRAAVETLLDRLYAGTKLADREVRLGLLEKSAAEVAATKDSFLELATAFYPLSEQQRERDKARGGLKSRLRPVYMRGLLQWRGGLVAPDANSTLRVTFGKVEGVAPRDGLFYQPQTTLQGIVEKHTGTGEFNAPARQLAAIQALRAGKKTTYLDPRLGDVPVNFLATVDTTGGNSGSPALNAKGELCGLLFDGTYDTVASDIFYDTVRTRSILVDTRYLLWVMTEVDGAGHLVQEMGVAP